MKKEESMGEGAREGREESRAREALMSMKEKEGWTAMGWVGGRFM
jgi:hypothetical protein